jgi:hypothetical protein
MGNTENKLMTEGAIVNFLADLIVPAGLGICAAQASIASNLIQGKLPTQAEAAKFLRAELKSTEPSVGRALGDAGTKSHVVGIAVASGAYWIIKNARAGHKNRKYSDIDRKGRF